MKESPCPGKAPQLDDAVCNGTGGDRVDEMSSVSDEERLIHVI